MYGSETMNRTRYHLHAVLVHQGQASGGHYWSYVRKPPSLHVEPTPAVEVAGVKLSQTLSNSEAMSSPAMSTESGGGEGEGRGGGEGERKGGGERENQVAGPVEKTPGEKAKDSKKEDEGGVWLKFNDVSVYEVGWAEVVKESYGEHHNTSAYCLIYLSPQLHEAWAKNGEYAYTRITLYTCREDMTSGHFLVSNLQSWLLC